VSRSTTEVDLFLKEIDSESGFKPENSLPLKNSFSKKHIRSKERQKRSDRINDVGEAETRISDLFRVESARGQRGDDRLHGAENSNWGLNQNIEHSKVVQQLFQRLNENVSYGGSEVDRLGLQGQVSLILRISSEGVVSIKHTTPDSDSRLLGHFLTQVLSAIRNPLKLESAIGEADIWVRIYAGRFASKEAFPLETSGVQNGSIILHRNVVRVNDFLEVKNISPSQTSFQPGYFLDLENLWSLLFDDKPRSTRIEWDLEYRKQEFLRACEQQNAEGGCYKGGLIEVALGNQDSGLRYLEKACGLSVKEACDQIEILRAKTLQR
jgi:hypothetical protein